MKKTIRNILMRKGWYYRLRYSSLFKCYQYLFKPGDLRAHRREVAFYQSFLKNIDLVFDVGAYDGHKTAAFLELSQKVVCCEPDAGSLATLRQRFRKQSDRVLIEEVAVSDTEGETDFYIHHPGSAFNTISPGWKKLLEQDNLEKWNEKVHFSGQRTVSTTTLDALIRKYGRPDFLKLDVEGAEVNVLRGLSQPLSAVSFESLWPEYQANLEDCIALLLQLDPRYLFNIAVNEELVLPGFVVPGELFSSLSKGHITHLEIVALLPA